MSARATILLSVFVLASIAAFGGWYAAARRSAEVRQLTARIEALQANLQRSEPRAESSQEWPAWPVLETSEEPNAPGQPVPATVKEPKPQRRISGRKIVEGLGKQTMIFCRTFGQKSNEDFANFLRGWTGVDLDVDDQYTDETLGLLRGKFQDQLKVLDRDDALRSLRVREQLRERGENTSDGFPGFREREQDCKKALEAWLDEVGSYLEAGRLAEKGKPR